MHSTVQRAGFALGREGQRLVDDGSSERLRCASVLKPLVFWAARRLAPLERDPGRWQRLAAAAVTISANGPTDEVWEACGPREILGALEELSGVRFGLEPGGRHPFGRVLVTSGEVARAYAALAASREPEALQLLGWMLEVPGAQTFGVRPVVAGVLGVPPEAVAVKAGWFCDEDEERIRTHLVTVTRTSAGVIGTVALTAVPFESSQRRDYTAADRAGSEVIDWHERAAGETLRQATEDAARRIVN